MQSLMMDTELTITSMIQHAAKFHHDGEIVSHLKDGSTYRFSYLSLYQRAMQLANVLSRFNVKPGDRIGTIAWNHSRHLEVYYSVPCMGAVCHTINPRLFPEQIAFIVQDAADKILFVDSDTIPTLEKFAGELNSVEAIIVMTGRDNMPDTAIDNVYCYEELMAQEDQEYNWPDLDERSASSLCYTSGTTGKPKGALYSHRSTVLQVLSICGADWFAVRNTDCILLVVPMFHINAWTLPYAATMTGAKLVLPGADLSGENIHKLIETEEVTMSGGVPTVWAGVLDYLKGTDKQLVSLERLLIAGAAPSRTLLESYEKRYGVQVMQGWGGTECSGAATHYSPRREQRSWSEQRCLESKMKPGRPLYLVDIRIVDEQNKELPRDGKTPGSLQVRGAWIISHYYNATQSALNDDGWFDTGDIGTLDEHGGVTIVDRKKDLIKSGGEWISSIDIENLAGTHEDVMEAAVIAIPHEKWTERPLLIVKKSESSRLSKEDLYIFLKGKIANWWMPDDIVFISELPRQATGKISKLQLRQQYKNHRLPL